MLKTGKGKKPKQDDLLDMLSYLIPRVDHFATSIILDLTHFAANRAELFDIWGFRFF